MDAGRELQDLLQVGEVEILDQLLRGHHHGRRNFARRHVEFRGDASLAHRVGNCAALLGRERAERRDRQILRRLGRGQRAAALGARLGLRDLSLHGVRLDDHGRTFSGVGVGGCGAVVCSGCGGFREGSGLICPASECGAVVCGSGGGAAPFSEGEGAPAADGGDAISGTSSCGVSVDCAKATVDAT
jgi:hypothetical protein